jgi:hypothetical protein
MWWIVRTFSVKIAPQISRISMNTLGQMNKYPDEGWINQLYEETERLWEKHKNPSGYAIFYSPVLINPKIVIIGYNPGGDKQSFSADNHSRPPDEHEYLKKEYLLAKRMYHIFQYAGLTDELS